MYIKNSLVQRTILLGHFMSLEENIVFIKEHLCIELILLKVLTFIYTLTEGKYMFWNIKCI